MIVQQPLQLSRNSSSSSSACDPIFKLTFICPILCLLIFSPMCVALSMPRWRMSWTSHLLMVNKRNSHCHIEEVLTVPNGFTENSHFKSIITHFQQRRPHINIYQSENVSNVQWSMFAGKLQLDGTDMEPLYLGKQLVSASETGAYWDKVCEERIQFFQEPLHRENYQISSRLHAELSCATAIVQRMSFVTRSLQRNFLLQQQGAIGMLGKDDKTPVTIADFAVQAVVLDYIHRIFPGDSFIAEEDSSMLRKDDQICAAVLEVAEKSTGEYWSKDRLFQSIDMGVGMSKTKDTTSRHWILDPVDGTKGFLRGEHYCVALGLLENANPVLSVLGCPNLNLHKVMQRSIGSDLAAICADQEISDSANSHVLQISPSSKGSLFFAISGSGSHARSLSMPLNSGFELRVSDCGVTRDMVLCESAEASFGNRALTANLARKLQCEKPYLRLDGQCKCCVVSAGAAESTLRLPPQGYREKIWDHLPGALVVLEAGGALTDLNGNNIAFTAEPFLDAKVTGIVASNGKVHELILKALREN